MDALDTEAYQEEVSGDELNPGCSFYNKEEDKCDFPHKGIFGNGCLGKDCRFYKE